MLEKKCLFLLISYAQESREQYLNSPSISQEN